MVVIGLTLFLPLQDNPESSNCLGIFGLSLYTTERDLRQYFEKYGSVDSIQIVYDRQVSAFVCMKMVNVMQAAGISSFSWFSSDFLTIAIAANKHPARLSVHVFYEDD